MDRGDSGEEPLDDEPTPVPGSARDFDDWDVEEALDLDAFDEADGEAGFAGSVVDWDDPDAVDARNRERMAAALDVEGARVGGSPGSRRPGWRQSGRVPTSIRSTVSLCQ